MIEGFQLPAGLDGDQLDEYLAHGWFRMAQTIFTTDSLCVDNEFFQVYPLRMVLEKVKYGKNQKRLLASNKGLAIEIKPLVITAELEDIYSSYRSVVDFEAPQTVEEFIMDGETDNVYNSSVMELRDQGRLVAAGIFDTGDESIAAIMNFYHPDYRSKSLGKFLMLLEINHGLERGKRFFYPGYIVCNYSKFHYKLFPDPDAAEYYEAMKDEWVPYVNSSLSMKDALFPDAYLRKKK